MRSALALAAALLALGGGSVQAARTGCAAAGGKAPVARPQLARNIATGETGWFASPGLADLNGDGKLEIVAPFYSTFVFDSKGRLLGKGTATKGRVYAPGVVADLNGDKRPEIVVGGNDGTVAAYDLVGGKLRLVPGWPASTCSGGQCPEARGMAAADLDGDGRDDLVVTPDQGGGPVVAAYSGARLAAGLTGDTAQLARFLGIEDPDFRGGGHPLLRDTDGDGRADLVTGSGDAEPARVRVYKSATPDQDFDPFAGTAAPFGVFVG